MSNESYEELESYWALIGENYGEDVEKECRARLAKEPGEMTVAAARRTLQNVLDAKSAVCKEAAEALLGAPFTS